jgi:LmbE family N-acetylglucosaminyl deacetylase
MVVTVQNETKPTASLLSRIRRNLGWRWRRLRKAVLRRFAFRRLRRESDSVAVSDRPAVVFAPHQDDETLGCGGLIAAKCRLGAPITVVFLTDGGACSLDETTPEQRAEISAMRRQEALRALDVLGMQADDVVFLDLPDGELTGFRDADRQAAVGKIEAVLQRVAPQEVFLPFRNDFHPDHQATHRLVKAATAGSAWPVELWNYFVWSLWESSCLDVLSARERSQLVRIELPPAERRKKQAALAAYRSQYEPDPTRRLILLPDGFLRFFSSPLEYFLRERGPEADH